MNERTCIVLLVEARTYVKSQKETMRGRKGQTEETDNWESVLPVTASSYKSIYLYIHELCMHTIAYK